MAEATRKLNCRGCQTDLVDAPEVIDLGPMPLVEFPEIPHTATTVAPLRLVRCSCCQLVQLDHSLPADAMYRSFWYRSGINESMRAALKNVVDGAIARAKPEAGDAVLDIACNDGTLLTFFDPSLTRVGIDPADVAAEAEGKTGPIVRDYFNSQTAQQCLAAAGKRFKIITAIAMFYDLEEPHDFLTGCREILDRDGVLVIQMNYLPTMLADCAVDNICHEHLTYYSLTVLKHQAAAAGLEVVDVEQNDVNGGSIRAYICHSGRRPATSATQYVLDYEEQIGLNTDQPYGRFRALVDYCKRTLRGHLEGQRFNGRPVYAYGASTRGTTLIHAFGIGHLLAGVAERDERKYGRYMVSSGLMIEPETACRQFARAFLVLPYHFREAIVRREHNWLSNGGELVFPLPEPCIVTIGLKTTKLGRSGPIRSAG